MEFVFLGRDGVVMTPPVSNDDENEMAMKMVMVTMVSKIMSSERGRYLCYSGCTKYAH